MTFNPLEGLASRFHPDQFPEEISRAANVVDQAYTGNYQIALLSSSPEAYSSSGKGEKGEGEEIGKGKKLTQDTAYEISAAICGLRTNPPRHQKPIGRKIGFTNPEMWKEYSVDESNWSYLYEETVQDVIPVVVVGGVDDWQSSISGDAAATTAGTATTIVLDLSAVSALEPRIEPELVLGLAKRPSASMDLDELLACVEWIAHGFEIVVSIFAGWKFTAADTTAACALHHRLVVGPKLYLSPEKGGDSSRQNEDLINRMNNFHVDLSRNGTLSDSGKGSNALGGPISALHHLVQLLEQQDRHPILEKGEVITTGTLTSAPLIKNGDLWSTNITGIELPGLEVRFKM